MPEFNSAFNILTGAQVYQDYKSTLESLQQHQDEKIVKEAKAIIALLTSNESKEHWQGLKELKELHNNYKDTGVLPEAAKADLDKLSDYDNRYFYFAPKSGGVHDPGPLGGRYFHVGTGRQLLAKKDDFNDIAEYFSAGLLRARDPNIAPEIILLKPPSPLGNDVPPYLGSIYFENYEDLFKDIHITYYQLTLAKSLHKNLADLNIDKDTTTLRLQVSDPHDFNKDSIIEKLESSAVKLANIIAATQEEIEIDSDNNATSKKLQKQLDQLKAEHEKLTVQINELSHMSVDGTPENHLLLQEKANAALDILDRSEKPIKNYIDEREARIPQDRGRMLGTKQWLGLKEGKIFRKSILHKNKDG
ncbi:MAG TPA: hypothetical protein VHZ76_10930, partial [Gammaproteobacteria bacterium]|nr:hypothetical protein [Gammaproteobacteria bacterium]